MQGNDIIHCDIQKKLDVLVDFETLDLFVIELFFWLTYLVDSFG